MSDTNRVEVAYVEESTFGTTPASPTMQILRLTGESLRQESETVRSQEIRSDRQTPGLKRVGLSASGDINGELSYSTFDDFLRQVLQSSAWAGAATVINASVNVSAQASDNSLNLSAGSWTTTPAAGEWIRVSGFTGTGTTANGYFRVVSATSTKIVVSGVTLVDDAAGEAVTIKRGDKITNGTTFKSNSIEKRFTSVSNTFELLKGMAPNTMNLSVASGSIVSIAFGFLGKNAVSGTSSVAGGNTAATSTDVMNAVDDVVAILENMVTMGSTEFTLSLNNNLGERLQIATLGAVSLRSGSIDLTGTIKAYLSSNALLDKFLNATASAFAIVFKDAAGNAIIFDVPRVKYSSGQRVAGGINQDVIADLAWTAERDPTLGYMIGIHRIAV